MVNGNLGYSNYQQGYQYQPYGQQNQYQQTGNNYYQQGQQTQQQVIPPKVIDCVQGELAATIYPVAYGQEVILFDMDDNERLYRKSRDMNGKVSPLEKLKIVIEEEKKQVSDVDMNEYVKVDDILDIVDEAVQTAVEKKLSEISFKPTASENRIFKKGSDK